MWSEFAGNRGAAERAVVAEAVRTPAPGNTYRAPSSMKVKIDEWHAVATWTWNAEDDSCGICRCALPPPSSVGFRLKSSIGIRYSVRALRYVIYVASHLWHYVSARGPNVMELAGSHSTDAARTAKCRAMTAPLV